MEWVDETLVLSLSTDLKAQILNKYEELEVPQQGAFSLFYTITRILGVQNQEVTYAMQDWFWNVSLLSYDCKNVTTAAMRAKVMSKALTDNFPTNIVSLVLKGFGKVPNDMFRTNRTLMESLLENFLFMATYNQQSTHK